jgi:hypothetical protein
MGEQRGQRRQRTNGSSLVMIRGTAEYSNSEVAGAVQRPDESYIANEIMCSHINSFIPAHGSKSTSITQLSRKASCTGT